METLNTERLILRQWQESDADDLFYFCKESMVENAGWKPHKTLEDSLKYIKSALLHRNSWAISLNNHKQVIGVIELYGKRHNLYREIDFIISQDYQNQGYVTEAVRSVLAYAFGQCGVSIIGICHYPSNLKSKRVIEKCGFIYEGTLRRYSRNVQDSVRYSMTKEEWQGLK